MRVLITTTQVPFTHGGAEIHAKSLKNALLERGHDAEIVAIPFKWYPPEKIMENLLACRMLDITESCGVKVDRVIGLKFPTYHIPHPNKRLWILHQYRSAFDLWGRDDCDLAQFPNGQQIKDAITRIDQKLLHETAPVYANSMNVAKRMKNFCGIDAEPLYHPPKNAEKFHQGNFDDYFYYPSRICDLKRQQLVIEALKETKEKVKVVFSGKPDNPKTLTALQKLAKSYKVDKRITWMGLISDEELIETYANCLGVVFVPVDEDYGYITLEAMLSGKPVITCSDSGGPLEFVEHEKSGFVSDPTPSALANAMDQLWRERSFAREAGQRGRKIIEEKGINWDNVINKLLS